MRVTGDGGRDPTPHHGAGTADHVPMRWTERAPSRVSVFVLGLVVSACAGKAGVAPVTESVAPTSTSVPAATSTTATPSAYGGTVVVGIADGGAPRTLNPFLEGPDAAVLDLVAPALFAQAFDIDPEGRTRVPDAVTGVPSQEEGTLVDNGDGTTQVTVSVVDGAQWADGTPISGADLEFTYRIAVDPTLPIRQDVSDAYDAIVPGSVTSEGRTISFAMEGGADPTGLFSVILPAHEVEAEDFAVAWDDQLWVSGGPFVLTDFEPGRFLELRRNPRYWKVTAAEDAPLPFLDRIVIRFYEPGSGIDPRLITDFSSTDVDVVVFDHAETRADSFEASWDEGAKLLEQAGGEWEHLNFQFGPANRNRESRNASTAFRRAVLHAIDRPSLAAARSTTVADSILQRFVPGLGDAPWARYDFDPVETARLLGDSEPPVVLTVPGDDARALALGGDIVTMLRDAGFDAELQLEDAAVFFGSTLDDGSWDVGVWRFGSGTGVGAARQFMHFYDPDGLPFVGTNFFRWGTVDSLVDDGATARYREVIDALDASIDPETTESLLVEAEQILADQAVLLPLLLAGVDGVGYWVEEVTGVAINPAQGVFWNVDVWRVPDGGDTTG